MNIRQGRQEDLQFIFMMGFDAWSEGQSEADYLERCTSSPKYPQGTWYVLESDAGLPGVCMALCFRDSEELLGAVPAFF